MKSKEQLFAVKRAESEHDILGVLLMRWSPRTFSVKNISNSSIQRLFEATRWSASSYNNQPWRFIYANKGSLGYDKIFQCLTDENKEWAVNAPYLMLTCYTEECAMKNQNSNALYDLGLCLGNMTTQAQYMGIALHHINGLDRKKAHELFEIPDDIKVSTAIAIGYYGGDENRLTETLKNKEFEVRKRNSIEKFAFNGSWNNSELK